MYKQGRLSFLAVDEAHCISSWGHDFRPAFRKLVGVVCRWLGNATPHLSIHHQGAVKGSFPHLPIIALTATATSQVQLDVRTTLALNPDTRTFVSSFDRPNITYAVEYVDLMTVRCSDSHSSA